MDGAGVRFGGVGNLGGGALNGLAGGVFTGGWVTGGIVGARIAGYTGMIGDPVVCLTINGCYTGVPAGIKPRIAGGALGGIIGRTRRSGGSGATGAVAGVAEGAGWWGAAVPLLVAPAG